MDARIRLMDLGLGLSLVCWSVRSLILRMITAGIMILILLHIMMRLLILVFLILRILLGILFARFELL